VWDLYPVTGAALTVGGSLILLDDVVSHAFGIPTPLDELWKRVLFPIMQKWE